MNYYGGKELAAAFRTVRKNTIQIAEDVPESQYGFKPSPESRTIGQTLAHIAVATTFPTMLHGERIPIEKIDFAEYMKKVGAEEAKPRTKAEIVALLKRIGREVRRAARGARRFVPGRSASRSARARSRRRGRVSTWCSRRRNTRCTIAPSSC